jgi:hypothetical protein
MAKTIIERIEQYCRIANIQESSLGVYIMGDPGLIVRVRAGKTLTTTLTKIENWLKANPPNKRRRRGRPTKQGGDIA